MALLPTKDAPRSPSGITTNLGIAVREEARRKQVVSAILLVIVFLQLVDFPGAIMMHSFMAIGTVLLGLVLCGVAMLFNQFGRVGVVSILLILVVDLGCGLMLLTSPMGLDASDLPVFDVLIVSELIAVSLLPAVSVFPVALSNILFILAVLALMPRTPALNMMLASDMAYNTIIQPVSLQIVVAVVAYIWVRSALRAIARADRAEEIAQLQRNEAELLRRETERTRQLDMGSEHLLQVLVRAANGDRLARANLPPDNLLWRVGNGLNVLLTRLRRAGQAEYEMQQLREVNAQLTQRAYETKVAAQQPQQPVRTSPLHPNQPRGSGINKERV
jgi:hypothetical protein